MALDGNAVEDDDAASRFDSRWNEAGRRLFELSPELWACVFALIKLYIANLGGDPS